MLAMITIAKVSIFIIVVEEDDLSEACYLMYRALLLYRQARIVSEKSHLLIDHLFAYKRATRGKRWQIVKLCFYYIFFYFSREKGKEKLMAVKQENHQVLVFKLPIVTHQSRAFVISRQDR